MKRIKAINGYTIFQHTARDEKDGLTVGNYSIYFSSDIKDFGREFSYPEFEDVETLEICEELCNNNFAIAKELCEEESTCVSMEDIESKMKEIEKEERKEVKAMEENRKYLEGIREDLESIYNGEQVNEDGEQVSFYDYISDCLDFEYIINSRKEYKSCKIWVTLGGPNVWIDTDTSEIKLAWGADRESIWLPSEICEEIDYVMEEYFNM